jgi:hypothetical protein
MTTATPKQFPALESVTRPTVDTASAAYYLNRKQQTLRCWSIYGEGPVRPIRINGRLAWPVSELRRVLGVVPTGQQSESLHAI